MSDTLFDDESEFALSQFDLESFLRQEEQLGNLPYPRSIHIDDAEDFSFRKKQNDDRFQRPASTDDVERTRIMSFPASTVKNTNWGINTYDSWGRWRNSYVQKHGQHSSEQYSLVPPLTSELTAAEVDFWLSRFVVEVSDAIKEINILYYLGDKHFKRKNNFVVN
jgi:hypothetical protein